MFRHILFAATAYLAAATVYATESENILFAVDISMTRTHTQQVYDLIQTLTDAPSDSVSLGITLFDDTVRRFTPIEKLVSEVHVAAIKQVIIDPPSALRQTSNLAVGIERAIDDPVPAGKAELIVFARGEIDTQTDDPRAQFKQWLGYVLLPQATEKNISITMVLPNGLTADPEISDAFSTSGSHRIISWRADGHAPLQLLELLGLPDKAYGNSTIEAIAQSSTSLPVEISQSQSQSQSQTQTQSPEEVSSTDWLPDVRIALLMLTSLLFIFLIVWRYRTTRNAKPQDHTVQHTSTYLPLSTRPGETMDSWADGRSQPGSASKSNTSPVLTDTQRNNTTKDLSPTAVEKEDPWDRI